MYRAKALPEFAREARRVLRPGGRLLAIDFTAPSGEGRRFVDHFHRHGFIRLDDIATELEAAGFGLLRSGRVGEKNLSFVLATAGPAGSRVDSAGSDESLAGPGAPGRSPRRHGGRLLAAIAGIGAVLALIALHAGAALSLGHAVSDWSLVAAGALALLVVAKIGLFGWWAHRAGAGVLGAGVGARHERVDDT
jgi:hypothetical protein